jgi:hypothetical protein
MRYGSRMVIDFQIDLELLFNMRKTIGFGFLYEREREMLEAFSSLPPPLSLDPKQNIRNKERERWQQ